MNNKNRLFRVTSLLLVLCFISTAMISGTFAKYTSEYAGADTALIAKWDLDVTDGGDGEFELKPDVAELDLFSHSISNNMIANAGENKIIAPGVSGDFVLDVTNNSDVAAIVTFAFEKSGVNVPIEYSLSEDFDGTDEPFKTLAALTTALNNGDTFKELGPKDSVDPSDTATITVYWRWPFDVDDTDPTPDAADIADTALGLESAEGDDPVGLDGRTTYTLTVTATATQLDPSL